MTFRYTDPHGDHLEAAPVLHTDGPYVSILITNMAGRAATDIPLDRVEEVIAGIRDTARQAAGGTP